MRGANDFASTSDVTLDIIHFQQVSKQPTAPSTQLVNTTRLPNDSAILVWYKKNAAAWRSHGSVPWLAIAGRRVDVAFILIVHHECGILDVRVEAGTSAARCLGDGSAHKQIAPLGAACQLTLDDGGCLEGHS